MYEFTFPFRPPVEDCRMQLTTAGGAKVYIYDTFCKNQTPEEKRRIDTELVKWYNDVLAHQAAEAAEKETRHERA